MTPAAPPSRLLTLLSDHGSVSASDMELIVRTHREEGGNLAALLLREGILDEDQLYHLLHSRLKLPAIAEGRLRRLKLPPAATRRLPRPLAREVKAVPVAYEPPKGLLTVAMLDPTDTASVERIRQGAQVAAVKPLLARCSPLEAMINQLYGEAGEVEVTQPAAPLAGQEAKVELDPSMAQAIRSMEDEEDEPDEGIPTLVVQASTILAETTTEQPTRVRPSLREEDRTTPPVTATRPRQQVVGRSLLGDEGNAGGAADVPAGPYPPVPPEGVDPEEATPMLGARPGSVLEESGHTEELDLEILEEDEDGALTGEAPPTTGEATPQLIPLPDVEQMEQFDALLRELVASAGTLVSLYEGRMDPPGRTCRELGKVTRAVAREAGHTEMGVARVTLAAQLFGLDRLMRLEQGAELPVDPIQAFRVGVARVGMPAGLRSLGRRALGLLDPQPTGAVEPAGAQLLRVVARFMDLRSASEMGAADPDEVSDTLRKEGYDPVLINALVKAMEVTAKTFVR